MNAKLYQERFPAALSGESGKRPPGKPYCWRPVERGLSHNALMNGRLMTNRLQLMLACLFMLPVFASTFGQEQRPDVLFVSVDDLNDWIEPLGGHLQAVTPNFTRFMKRSVCFTNASCPSPGCNPSRTAIMTTYDFGEFSVRSERYRYTRYIDGSEELYDHQSDAEEWHNLAQDPKFSQIKKELAAKIPVSPAPLVKTSEKLQPHHIPPFRSRAEYDDWLQHEKDYQYLLKTYWK